MIKDLFFSSLFPPPSPTITRSQEKKKKKKKTRRKSNVFQFFTPTQNNAKEKKSLSIQPLTNVTYPKDISINQSSPARLPKHSPPPKKPPPPPNKRSQIPTKEHRTQQFFLLQEIDTRQAPKSIDAQSRVPSKWIRIRIWIRDTEPGRCPCVWMDG